MVVEITEGFFLNAVAIGLLELRLEFTYAKMQLFDLRAQREILLAQFMLGVGFSLSPRIGISLFDGSSGFDETVEEFTMVLGRLELTYFDGKVHGGG